MNKQHGGERIIPEFKDDAHSPFKTKQQLESEYKDREEKRIKTANIEAMKPPPEPLMEFKINPEFIKQPAPQTQPIYPIPFSVAQNQPYRFGPVLYEPMAQPVNKVYNISFGGVDGNHASMSGIYEDILPTDEITTKNTFNTIKERNILHKFVQTIFVKTAEGEDVNITGATKNEVVNLLVHLKLLDINPYHYDETTKNPYKTLPERFVLYRSCFPIKLTSTNQIECAKSSIGLNVRIYLLSKLEEELINVENTRLNMDSFRELEYYKYIRDEILIKKVSPNFVMMHAYYYAMNTGLNFRKFDELRNIYKNVTIEKMKANERNKLYKEIIEKKGKILGKPDEDSDKCLVILTESPTINILNWAKPAYKLGTGGVKKMIQSGFHSDEVWESITTQLIFALLTMYTKKIMFTDLSLKNNVYIKDLQFNEQNIGYWKYVFNGIDYYVPNYGYLLLIDSNYTDNDNSTKKIIGNIYSDSKFNNDIFIEKTKSILGELTFTSIKEKIMAIISSINENIENFLVTLINKFKLLHNRVGTLLKDIEKQNVSQTFDPNTVKGSIVVYKTSVEIWYFAIYIGNNKIIYKDGLEFKIGSKNMFNYFGTLDLAYESGKQMNLLETYNI